MAHIGETLSQVRITLTGQSRGKSKDMESFSSYLAGFFDGDGSLHFQIVRQKEYRFGFYIRSSLVFYQSTSCESGLLEIQRRLGGIGRMRRRSEMSDLTTTGRTGLGPSRPSAATQKPTRLPGDMRGHDFASLNFSKSRTITSAVVQATLRDKGAL